MSSAPQVPQAPRSPAAVAPAVGDRVQIREVTWRPDALVAKPPVPSGRAERWLYATVEEVTPAGVKVTIRHAGNRRHGETLTVQPEDVRTAAEVAQLAAQARTPEAKTHFDRQAKVLAPKGK